MRKPFLLLGAPPARGALLAAVSLCATAGAGALVGLRPGARLVPSAGPGFRDVTARAGLQFRYDNDASPAHRYVETTGGGCAFLDFDNDGRLDIFAVQGGPAPGGSRRPRPPHALYRNLGDGRFSDVTEAAGLKVDTGYGQGVAAADYDNDGWTDLVITAYGGPRLFHNRRGRFEERTKPAGLVQSGEPHWATSAAWADYDRDGRLDLFVCHYVSWFPDVELPCLDQHGKPMYCSPTAYPGDAPALYRNNGDGTFTDVSKRAGLAKLDGKALGAVWLDHDDDGWPDLFVASDMAANWLLRNQKDGTFREVAAQAGVACGPGGLPLSGMGVAASDFDGNQKEDLFVVNFSLQPRSYYLNRGGGLFEWAGAQTVGGESSQPFLAFGVETLDYDRDGCPDLVLGNGHLNRQVSDGVTYRQRQQLLHNAGDGRLVEDRRSAGDLDRPRVTRGLATGDFDNDGRADCLVSGPDEPLALFRNECAPESQWIGFRLEGRRSNRDGIGARVRLTSASRTRTQTVRSGSSYCSHSDTRALFGLGSSTRVDAVEVRWPAGAVTKLLDLIPGRYYLVTEDGACRPDPRLSATAGASPR
jgi:hypothetical protein